VGCCVVLQGNSKKKVTSRKSSRSTTSSKAQDNVDFHAKAIKQEIIEDTKDEPHNGVADELSSTELSNRIEVTRSNEHDIELSKLSLRISERRKKIDSAHASDAVAEGVKPTPTKQETKTPKTKNIQSKVKTHIALSTVGAKTLKNGKDVKKEIVVQKTPVSVAKSKRRPSIALTDDESSAQEAEYIKIKRKSLKKQLKSAQVGDSCPKSSSKLTLKKGKKSDCLDLTEYKFKMVETMGENPYKRQRLTEMAEMVYELICLCCCY
jgi:hypothetical protein